MTGRPIRDNFAKSLLEIRCEKLKRIINPVKKMKSSYFERNWPLLIQPNEQKYAIRITIFQLISKLLLT